MCAYGRVLAEPRLSPDGSRVAYGATAMGRGSLRVVPVDGGCEVTVTSAPPPRPAAAYGGGVYDWTPDGTALVYAAVDGGLWLVPAAGGAPRQIVEALAAGPASSPSVSPDGTRVAYVVDAHHVAVAPLAPDGAWPVRLSSTADFCFDPSWSLDSDLVVWHEWDVPNMPWDGSRIVVRSADASLPPLVIDGGDDVSVQQPRFSPDGAQLAYLCDRAGWLNLWVASAEGKDPAPLLAEDHEHGDPSWGQGQRSYAWAPDGRAIAFNRNEAGFGRLCVVDLDGEVRELATAVHGGLTWVADRIAAIRSGARTPTSIVVYDVDTADRTTVARGPVGGFEELDLPEPQAVTWTGDDGAVVHGRLYEPTFSATGSSPPPMVVWIHGGPTGQWAVTFMARLVFFLERGWAILLPDHRGSTGHGREYAQALRGRWGDLDVSDVARGMQAAAESGWGDPRRMAPMGGSAGGFTVLNLLARHPELCAAGVDLFGVTDLFDLNETTHRFEAHYLQTIVGTLPAAADRYREWSPMSVVDRIQSPLLVLQGTADEVVPPSQSETVVKRLQALGRTVELKLYDDEGHGWNRPETIIDELTTIESFLRRHVLEWRS